MFVSIYYDKGPRRRKPAEEFLSGCDDATVQKFYSQKDRLEIYGTKLGPDHVKPIKDGLYELKVISELDVRMFCFFYWKDKFSDRHYIVFTGGLIKKTNKLPPNDIETNVTRMNDFKNRVRSGKIKLTGLKT